MVSRPTPRIILVIAILVTASLACSMVDRITNRGGSPGAQPAPAERVEATVAPGLPEDSQVVPEPENEPDETQGEVDIPNITDGLDALDSYRMSFQMTFTGKDEQGEDQNGSLEILEEVNRPQNTSHMRYTNSGDLSTDTVDLGQGIEMYTIGEMQYMLEVVGQDASSCTSYSSGETPDLATAYVDPSDWIGEIHQARLVQRGEVVNGVQTDHYQFDEKNMSLSGISTASGDLWLAQDGGYTVRMTAQAQGSSFFSLAADGEASWDYSLEQANQDVTINLPAECESQAPSADVPIPGDATDKSVFSGMTTFKSSQAPEQIADYYRSGLADQGWEITSDSSLGELIMLEASKENRTLSVMITKEGDSTSVVITEKK